MSNGERPLDDQERGEGRASVPVVFYPHGGPAGFIRFSPPVAAALGVRPGSPVPLRLHGTVLSLTAAVRETGDPARVFLSPRALATLRLPPGVPLRLYPRENGQLEVGPFLGVLSPPRKAGNPYQAQTSFFRRLLQYGQRQHLGVFVFSSGEVDWRNRRVRGWTYIPGRGWLQRNYPLPHAVYSRGHASSAGWGRFHRLGIPIFNTRVGSKWWQYRLFRTDPLTAAALPETRRVRSARDLALLLNRYGSVYVKSVHGGKGIDVWQVTAAGNGRFLVRHTNRFGRSRGSVMTSLGPLARAILRRPRQPFIVQARLWLMRWRDRIFDIRALAQKDDQGRWQITGMGVRVGPRGSIVSNLHGGGAAMPLETVLAEVLTRRSVQEVKEECRRLALRVAELVDRACTRIGELGIDLALDADEKLWILEANSATGRNVFRRLGPPEVALAADVRPLHYAAYLAGFGEAEPWRNPSRSPSM